MGKVNKNIEVLTMKKEISGFGGGYEKACRNMLLEGLKWFKRNPFADPQFSGYKNIYGVIDTDNKDASSLSSAVVKGAKGDCTGAMHQAVISHLLFIKQRGLKKYLKHMNSNPKPKKTGDRKNGF